MSLRDFMQQLQEQDNDVVYSKPPEETIQIIPPENSKSYTENIKIIPPQIEEVEPPKVIKFKIKNKPEAISKQETVDINKLPDVIVIPPKKEPEQQEIVATQPKQPQRVVEKPQQQEQSVDVERLFRLSGTEESKKSIWMEYYRKAVKSTKNNVVTSKLRAGRFRILPDNQTGSIKGEPSLELLSDYITENKKNTEILNDKWI